MATRFIMRFFRHALPVCLLSLAFQAALAGEAGDPPVKPYEKYNVIVMFIDDLRADRLGCYGHSGNTSPNIDKLASESVVFEQNFTPATYTLASFTSIITSLYPDSHGVLDIFKDKLSSRVNTLAQILRTYGYKTAWFADLNTPHLDPKAGFGRGFEEMHDSGDNFYPSELRDILFDWLEKNKDKKFFLNFHTNKIHSPYFPDPKYKQKITKIKSMEGVIESRGQLEKSMHKFIRDGDAAAALLGKDFLDQLIAEGLLKISSKGIEDFFISRKETVKLTKIQDHLYWCKVSTGDKLMSAYMQALYDADILELDDVLIGPLIGKLKEMGIYDKTVIVICADHGDEFREHGGYSHGKNLYVEIARVPLIIHVPWDKKGRRVRELTQTVDIMPTTLDLLGIPVPHQAQGKSLMSFINDGRPSPLREYVFGSTHGTFCIRSKEWLLVLHDDKPDNIELYSLRSDRREQKNVYLKNKKVAAELKSKLIEWKASLPSYKDREYAFPPEIDKAAREKIKETGYW